MNRARKPGPVNPYSSEKVFDSILHDFTETLGTISIGIRSALHGFPTPGPLGRNDHADPNLLGRGRRHAVHGRGPVGSLPPAIADSLGKVSAGNSTKATRSVAQKSTPLERWPSAAAKSPLMRKAMMCQRVPISAVMFIGRAMRSPASRLVVDTTWEVEPKRTSRAIW